MPRDGNGNYSLPNPPVVTQTTISSVDENTTRADVAAALTQSFSKDGQTVATANWNLGNNRITTMANPVNAQDASTKAYADTGDVWGLIADTAVTASANIDFSWTAGDYRAVHVLLQGVLPASAGASVNLAMQMRQSGAFVTGASDYGSILLSGGAAASYNNGLTSSGITLTAGGTNAAMDNVSGSLMVDPGGTGMEAGVTGIVRSSADALARLVNVIAGSLITTGAIDGLRFYWAGGINFAATGRIQVLGLKSSASVVASISLSDLATYDLPFDFGEGPPPSTATTNTLSTRLVRAITIPADFSGSVGGCGVNPTGAAAFVVAKNGSTIGTATINTAGVVSFVSATPGIPVACAINDVISMSAPVPNDATLETVTFALAAYRNL